VPQGFRAARFEARISSTRLRDWSEDGSVAGSPFVPLSQHASRARVSDYNKNASTVLNQKDLTLASQSLYKGYMSDIISNDAAHPEWRQLCQAALFELNPAKLLERIARARNAILDRIEDGHSKSPNGEETLRRITERQNGYQSKAS
jgi:hypothetical protein